MKTLKELANLQGRVAVITGAAGNLGKMIADTLAEMGAALILVDINKPAVEELCKNLILKWGVKSEFYACNLEDQAERLNFVNYVLSSYSNINILVNNAAFIGSSDLPGWNVPFLDQKVETWRRVMEVNLIAIFDLCQGLYPAMEKSDGSSIVNIASIYGVNGPDWSLYEGLDMGNPASYSASKGGLVQLNRWLATTLAPSIRVNSISPGGIFREQPKEFIERYEVRTPLKRMAKEEDFRGGIAYLTSDLSNYVTGQNLIIDGGWGAW